MAQEITAETGVFLAKTVRIKSIIIIIIHKGDYLTHYTTILNPCMFATFVMANMASHHVVRIIRL